MKAKTESQAAPDEAVEARLAGYLREVWPSDLKPAARTNLLALYRGIAAEDGSGVPVPEPHPEIPKAWLERDHGGQLIGVGGLSRRRTAHEIRLDGVIRFAWCAFDCLFLPGVLGLTLDVRSVCPASGRWVALRVSPRRVEQLDPVSAVISFVTPDAAAVEQRLREVFCGRVRFFVSAEAAASEIEDSIDLLTPDQAHRLGLIRNFTVLGDLLSPER